jgi:ABC-2 type transport system permease protein
VRRALHAEWTKLRTTSGPAWLAVAIVALTVGVSAIACGSVHGQSRPGYDPVRLGLIGIDLGQAVVACLAVQIMCAEYTTAMIRTTLMAMPRRLTVLAAKAAILTTVVLIAGTAAVLASLLVARLALPGNGFTAADGYQLISLGDGTTMRAAAGTVLYLVLVGLLSLGVTTAVRDAATAIGLVLGLLYLFPILLALVGNPNWHRHLEQIGPTTAGQAIEATTNLHGLVIGPWAGLGVLAAWTVGAVLVGGALFVVRDA